MVIYWFYRKKETKLFHLQNLLMLKYTGIHVLVTTYFPFPSNLHRKKNDGHFEVKEM